MLYQIIASIIASTFLLNNIWASDPITIDGLFNDWSGVPVAFSDPNGDGFEEDYVATKKLVLMK